MRVEPKIIDRPNNRVDLVFEINEGGKTTVKDIDFVGNRAYSAWRLRDVIKTGQTQHPELPQEQRSLRSRPHRSRPRAVAPLLSEERLCGRAHRLGGRRVRPGAATASSLTFTIEEGDRYRFGTIDIQSNVRDVDPAAAAQQAAGLLRRRLQRRGGREVGRGDDDRGGEARLRLRAGAPARRPQFRRPARQHRLHRSRRARAPTSSASISAATRARATTSSGASSISPKATPTTARWSTAPSGG